MLNLFTRACLQDLWCRENKTCRYGYIYMCYMNREPLRLQLHVTASLLLAALEFVWRSGCCGSAVGIHHGSPCCGATFLLPPSNLTPHSPSPHCRQETASAAAICLQLRSHRVSSGEEIKKINPAVILIGSKMSHTCRQSYMFYIHIHTVYYILMDIFPACPKGDARAKEWK